MKEFLRKKIAFVASCIELCIAGLVLIAILFSGWGVLCEAFSLAKDPTASENFTQFLSHALTLVIGVEFIKMLAKHTPGSAIEVLLFAIARQMVVDHTSPMENLITIAAIAGLFAIRKYLFVPSFGAHMPGQPERSAFEDPEEPHSPVLCDKAHAVAADVQPEADSI
jgi:phosphate starvation-inducible membrane PsiE